MHIFRFLGLLVLTAVPGRGTSQIPFDESMYMSHNYPSRVITDELSSYIQNQLQINNVTGLSLGVVLPNGKMEFGAWGNRTEDGDPVTPGTVFNLGSCSKAFVSASLGILMQDFAERKNQSALPHTVREFNWDTKLRDLLPEEWKLEDEWTTNKADLKDLLSHVTGLPPHDMSYSPQDAPRDVVLGMRRLRTSHELRQHYDYNNMMFVTGAFVVSKYSGLSYRDFVEERILRPLGMNSSTLYPNRAFQMGNMTQSWTPFKRRIPFFMPEHSAELIAGAGGVMSTVQDMARWIEVLLNAGADGQTNDTIVPRATFDLATSAISVANSKGNGLFSVAGYGLGWGRLSYRGHEMIQHNGGAPGVATIVDLYPYDRFGVVVLANTQTDITRTIGNRVADHILQLPAVSQSTYDKIRPKPQSLVTQPSPLQALDGIYSNPGYGNFTLCSLLFSSTSTQCRGVIEDFRIVDQSSKLPASPLELYAAWPRFWGSHLRFVPIGGFSYLVKLSSLYVEGYGVDRTPFEDVSSETMTSTFMLEQGRIVGFGLFGAGDKSWRAKKGGSVRDIADVFFDKL
ncbi:beta-lactamase/transpeptidase-like protein [Mycena crocata]|nr:beta-lactamase/transpeptidase-like protein [Mycena crocata]